MKHIEVKIQAEKKTFKSQWFLFIFASWTPVAVKYLRGPSALANKRKHWDVFEERAYLFYIIFLYMIPLE